MSTAACRKTRHEQRSRPLSPTLTDADIDAMLNPLDGFEPRVGADGQPVAPDCGPVNSIPGGEFGTLGRRQFTNNVKAVRDVLDDLIAGRNFPTMAATLLQSLGLSPDRANALIQDARRSH